VDFDPGSGTQLEEHFEPVLSERTRLVAMTAASNLIGTRPPVRAVSHRVHDLGALLWVDGVHATAHDSVDIIGLGADFWTCSPYKLLGPHCGVVAAASPEHLERLHPDKLLPSTDAVPERFELGTLPYELMAGTTAAIDFIAGLVGPGEPNASRRERILSSYAALHEHETVLVERLERGLRALPGVRVYSNAEKRTPTLLFTIEGMDSQDVAASLAQRQVNAPASSFYAIECSRHLGLGDAGGVRVGLAPYTDDRDVDRLLTALAALTEPSG